MKRIGNHRWSLLLLVLAIGNAFFLFRDYGMGWDEIISRENGVRNALYANERLGYPFLSEEEVEQKIRSLKEEEGPPVNNLTNYKDRHYGPFFEMLLLAGEFVFKLEEPKKVYQWRHLGIHLFFLCGVIVFYFLMQSQFQDWRISLLGCGLLFLSPRIFAHSFFNSKDIPFLVACIFCSYSLLLLLKNFRSADAVFHAFFCAMAIDIRLIGLVIVPLTLGMLFLEAASDSRGKGKWIQAGKVFLVFSVALIFFTILFWPFLWENPLERFLEAFRVMGQFPWKGDLLFLGKLIKPYHGLPFFYIPLWVATSISPVVLAGLACWLAALPFARLFSWTPGNRLVLISVFMILGPWIATLLLHSVLYDGWRHFFFIYPFLVVLSLSGFLAFKRRLNLSDRVFFSFLGVVVAGMVFQLYQLHPNQQVYFNRLAGRHPESRFELDYWGVSYFQGLNFLVDFDRSEEIRLAVFDLPGANNAYLLDEEARKRIKYVELSDADYFMTVFRSVVSRDSYLQSLGVDPELKIFSIRAGPSEILAVFRLKKDLSPGLSLIYE